MFSKPMIGFVLILLLPFQLYAEPITNPSGTVMSEPQPNGNVTISSPYDDRAERDKQEAVSKAQRALRKSEQKARTPQYTTPSQDSSRNQIERNQYNQELDESERK